MVLWKLEEVVHPFLLLDGEGGACFQFYCASISDSTFFRGKAVSFSIDLSRHSTRIVL